MSTSTAAKESMKPGAIDAIGEETSTTMHAAARTVSGLICRRRKTAMATNAIIRLALREGIARPETNAYEMAMSSAKTVARL